jgi:nucleotide-binding universal stress UspA family protein
MTPKRRSGRPFSSVLCPVDFSRHSRAALEYGAAVALRAGGMLTALFVNDPLLVAAAAAAYDTRALASRSEAELRRFVRRVIGAHVAFATTVSTGDPAREILRAARSTGADLIVVGSEGLGGASKLFFGSTTARLLAKAAVPVLAVPPSGPSLAKESSWPAPCVLAAIELGREATRDVSAAADVAKWFGARLALVHVVEPTRAPRWLSLRGAAGDRARLERARSRLGRLASDASAAGPVGAHVMVGDPAAQIAALATDLDAGLLIVTLREESRLFGDRQGAMTYRVLREAGTPVLAVPAGWRLPVARSSKS